MRRFTYT